MSKSDELMNEQREAAMKLTKAEVVAKLEAAPRQFATTMARFPHSYTYIDKHGDYWTSEWDYDVMCTAINRWRTPRPFLNRTTWYFDANGRQYWLMPSPKTESGELVVAHRNLINIAPRWYDQPEVSIYEQPAFEYEKYAVYEKLRMSSLPPWSCGAAPCWTWAAAPGRWWTTPTGPCARTSTSESLRRPASWCTSKRSTPSMPKA